MTRMSAAAASLACSGGSSGGPASPCNGVIAVQQIWQHSQSNASADPGSRAIRGHVQMPRVICRRAVFVNSRKTARAEPLQGRKRSHASRCAQGDSHLQAGGVCGEREDASQDTRGAHRSRTQGRCTLRIWCTVCVYSCRASSLRECAQGRLLFCRRAVFVDSGKLPHRRHAALTKADPRGAVPRRPGAQSVCTAAGQLH